MKDILKSVSKLTIPTAINLITSILKNKILSVIVGPVGLGIYSQFVNLSGLISAVFPIGSLGLVKYIASLNEDKKYDEISYLLLHFFKRNLLFSLIFSLLLIVFDDLISTFLFSDSQFSNLLILFSSFVPLNLLLNLIDIYIKGIRKIDIYVKFLSVNSLLTILVTLPLIYFWGIFGAVLALTLSLILNLVSGFILLKRNKILPRFNKIIKVENPVLKNIYQIGIAVLLSMVLQNVTILLIKSIVASKLGLNSVGIFQSVYSISTAYFGIFFSLIGSYSIPKISSLKNNKDILVELNSTIKFLLLVYVPLITLIFVFRGLIISVLYSSDFFEAKSLFIFQMPAELIRALSWIIGLWLIPGLKIRQWVFFDFIFYNSFFLLFYLMINFTSLGIESVSISYLISYILFFIINYLYASWKINFKFSSYNLKLIYLSVTVLAVIFGISNWQEIFGFYVFTPLILIWLFSIVNREDFNKLKEMLIKKKHK